MAFRTRNQTDLGAVGSSQAGSGPVVIYRPKSLGQKRKVKVKAHSRKWPTKQLNLFGVN